MKATVGSGPAPPAAAGAAVVGGPSPTLAGARFSLLAVQRPSPERSPLEPLLLLLPPRPLVRPPAQQQQSPRHLPCCCLLSCSFEYCQRCRCCPLLSPGSVGRYCQSPCCPYCKGLLVQVTHSSDHLIVPRLDWEDEIVHQVVPPVSASTVLDLLDRAPVAGWEVVCTPEIAARRVRSAAAARTFSSCTTVETLPRCQ